MKLLIKNGTVINPSNKMLGKFDILVEDGVIKEIEKDIIVEADSIINADGKWVTPGLIDVHVHLREPGYEYKETIATGSRSAARGGFTTICAMPNTNPVVDSELIVDYIKLKAEKEAIVHVLPIGAITKGQEGKELVNIEKLVKAGVCAISEDGKSVIDAGLLKKAMTLAKEFNLPVLSHCEDETLAGAGSMNSGETATNLGLMGISDESEEVIVSRDIILANKTGVKLHLCHISTKGSIDIIKHAKNSGQVLTAEVCPHHFTLTEKSVDGYDANTKMNPPLRAQEDVDCIKEALSEGIIEVIATDHAPHHIDEKTCGFEKAANGIVGLETALSLSLTELVNKQYLTPLELIEKMSYNPAKLLGIDKGDLTKGKIADITIIDPNEVYKIDVSNFVSKSKNSPFHNREVKGKVKYTIVNGQVVFEDK